MSVAYKTNNAIIIFMMAEIIIDELELSTIIGCMKNERTTKQALTLSLAIQYDISKVSKSDNIDDALNYATICHDLKEKIENKKLMAVMVSQELSLPKKILQSVAAR